jgi:hypothetical protein
MCMNHTFSSRLSQVDGVLELIEFHLDEDLTYKIHWHLQEANGQIHLTEFVEYMCCQHKRIQTAKQGDVDAHQTVLRGAADRVKKFTNPVSDAE